MSEPESAKRQRWIPAPLPSHPGLHSTLLNVECAEDEDVDWQWTETAAGRFVSGYQIVPREIKPLVEHLSP